jgi:transketolase
LAPVFADLGLVEKEALKTFNHTNSSLGIHLDKNKVKGLDASTGSLGHGSALALGMILAARVKGQKYKAFVILGDGECNEGSVWEAAMATSHFKATDLITIVDRNKMMIDGPTEEVMGLEPFADKWTAFGFETIVVNGHDMNALSGAIEKALAAKDKPVCIIADTVKGEGIDFIAGDFKWHYGAFDDTKYENGKKSLAAYAAKRVERAEKEGV